MPNEENVMLNYETLYHKAMDEVRGLRNELLNLESKHKELENVMINANREISFLNGQVEAFRFCVSRWGDDNG